MKTGCDVPVLQSSYPVIIVLSLPVVVVDVVVVAVLVERTYVLQACVVIDVPEVVPVAKKPVKSVVALSRTLWSPLTTVEECGDRAVPVVDHVLVIPVSRLLPVVGQFLVVRSACECLYIPRKSVWKSVWICSSKISI